MVIRRVGGLEVHAFAGLGVVGVIRRVGGLEERCTAEGRFFPCYPPCRRFLAKQPSPEPRAKERVIFTASGGLEFLKILRMSDRRAGG